MFSMSKQKDALNTGYIGELLAMYKLVRLGEQVAQMPQQSKYDLVVMRDTPVRIQVKAAGFPVKDRPHEYLFTTSNGSVNKTYYEADAFDVLCLVALDIEKVLFMPNLAQKTKRISVQAFEDASGDGGWFTMLDTLGH